MWCFTDYGKCIYMFSPGLNAQIYCIYYLSLFILALTHILHIYKQVKESLSSLQLRVSVLHFIYVMPFVLCLNRLMNKKQHIPLCITVTSFLCFILLLIWLLQTHTSSLGRLYEEHHHGNLSTCTMWTLRPLLICLLLLIVWVTLHK